MQSLRAIRYALVLPLLAVLLQPPAAPAQAPAPEKFKSYTVDTIDGVHLKVNLFKGNKGKDGVTVLLLHHFDKQGGDSTKGMKSLAEAFQKAGHTVVTFDFRGHGESTSIDKDVFWANEFLYNQRYINRPKGGVPESISHGDFKPAYYAYLVNDITTVRAFLDRLNDNGDVNTSNIVVVGAGQGATLGALWMASEYRRRQAKPIQPNVGLVILNQLPLNNFILEKEEGRDLAAAIFLSISPTLGGQTVPIVNWIKDLGREQKLPMAFIYGKEEEGSPTVASQLLKSIDPTYAPDRKNPPKDFELLKELAVETKLGNSQLLAAEFPTENWILKTFLNDVFEKRTLREQRTRDFEKYPNFWLTNNGLTRTPARILDTDKSPRPLPLAPFGINR